MRDSTTCPHEDVVDVTTWGDLGRGTEQGLCCDCGKHLSRKIGEDEWT